MKFNAYELEYTPDDCTEPRPQKSVSIIETYSSVQFFNWGIDPAGDKDIYLMGCNERERILRA